MRARRLMPAWLSTINSLTRFHLPEEFAAIWESILMKHFDRFCRGELSAWGQRRERMREVFRAPELSDAECDVRYRAFVAEYEPRTRAFPDAKPCLESLLQHRLGIISNGVRDQQIGKLKRAGLLSHFSVMVFSEDAGLGKPNSRIFIKACEQAGENPRNCTHVGDSIEADVLASRSLGMHGIFLDRSRSVQVSAPVISSLSELPSALQAIPLDSL
jgi:putative hydrolase of the HAD superfamily